VNSLKARESIRCRLCGYRIMYKASTARDSILLLLSPPHTLPPVDLTRYGIEPNPGMTSLDLLASAAASAPAAAPLSGKKREAPSKSEVGDAFEKKVLAVLDKHPQVDYVKQLNTGDMEGDLLVRRKGDPIDDLCKVQCRTRSAPGSGITSSQIDKFGAVVFVLQNPQRSRFYVAIGSDLTVNKLGGSRFVGRDDLNAEYRIDYDGESGRSEDEAWSLVAQRIVDLLPRSAKNIDKLAPGHAKEKAGISIMRHLVADSTVDVVFASSQPLAYDVLWAGEKVQVKTTATPTKAKTYFFHLQRSGSRRPYEAGVGFAFVALDCASRFYILTAKQAQEMKLVGEGAPTSLTLPGPEDAPEDHAFANFLFPRKFESSASALSCLVKRKACANQCS
jgi:hypothetical protein